MLIFQRTKYNSIFNVSKFDSLFSIITKPEFLLAFVLVIMTKICKKHQKRKNSN